ncbi:RNA exonuclease 4-like [Musca domestica]|uniref:RNA exonuclease 4 n=1 Tax=Musca domestica TaxID=7370 RepID=A0A1I8NEF0_MUSDO|nr:RNA exonuclease 4-like [Musca domestica]
MSGCQDQVVPKRKKRRNRKKMSSESENVSLDDKKEEQTKPLHTSMERLQVQNNNVQNVNVSRSAAGSNWEAMRQIRTTSASGSEQDVCGGKNEDDEKVQPPAGLSKSARLRQKRKTNQWNKYVAMDCEMVGVGFNGQEDMLARVSIVNKNGEIIIDKFVKPQEAVTDYRTSISGIRPHDIENGEEFKDVQNEVVKILQGKILVGHAIRNDLSVLHIKHPFSNIRDTARYKPLCRLVANGRTPSLKRLSQAILGQEIQTGEHNSVEDARATMHIYNRLSKDWEAYLRRHQHRKL